MNRYQREKEKAQGAALEKLRLGQARALLRWYEAREEDPTLEIPLDERGKIQTRPEDFEEVEP